jgi:hypothetical protein
MGAQLARRSLGEPDLAVPFILPRPLPAPIHAMARQVKPAALVLARWRDAREMR